MVSAEFFDIPGFIAFTILLIIGILMLKTKRKLPNWVAVIIIVISILGMVIDGFIVIKTYIIGG